jgi:hypothetical protein
MSLRLHGTILRATRTPHTIAAIYIQYNIMKKHEKRYRHFFMNLSHHIALFHSLHTHPIFRSRVFLSHSSFRALGEYFYASDVGWMNDAK